jgi:hypothetical protein
VTWQKPGVWRVTLVLVLACGQRSVPAPSLVPLGGDVARVGTVHVPMSLVARVVRARGVAPRDALDGIVDDALLAQAAKTANLEGEPSVAWASTATMARLVPERLYSEARSRGAPATDELAMVQVVHAVVLRSPTLSHARALALAKAVSHAVSSARSDSEFEDLAKKVPHPGAQVNVERLPKFDASGLADEGQEFDATFVAAAFRLRTRGETSVIVQTPFGWHVIRLIDRLAPDPTTLEARRRDLADAVLWMRVRTRLDALLNGEDKRTKVEVSSTADDLIANVASTR